MTLVDRLRARWQETAGVPAVIDDDGVRFTDRDPAAAAVLAAVVDRAEPTLLLTRRDDRLRSHPGQVAFPGGRSDPDDRDAVHTALREAEEEIGLPPAAVALVGADRAYRTGSGYCVTPVVGVIPPDLPLTPREVEVADIFEVPLAWLMDPLNRLEREGEWRGERRRYFEFLHERHRIWGVTAALIINLARRIGDG